jgi:hypothetical protein
VQPKVVMLSGGRGTRPQEHAQSITKLLVEIGGLTILWHVMRIHLAQALDASRRPCQPANDRGRLRTIRRVLLGGPSVRRRTAAAAERLRIKSQPSPAAESLLKAFAAAYRDAVFAEIGANDLQPAYPELTVHMEPR